MNNFKNVKKAVEDIKNGKMVLVTDDYDRENEGDLICAAQFASPEIINFMAKYARGLICMPVSDGIAEKLQLTQMVENNTDNHSTAFTVSIDYNDTTTGISAFERSLTAIKCADENSLPSDFRRPGHMFPLLSKEGGVFERRGHTEATVDFMKIAGLKEVGICCEIMKDDGNMMRIQELQKFASEFDITLVTIEELYQYKRYLEKSITREAEADLPTKYGDFKIYGYENKNSEQHLALVMGDINNGEPVLVRVHSECLTGDAFGSLKCDCGDQYDKAMKMISKEGRGILIYLRQEGRGIGIINKIKAYSLQQKGLDTVDANIALGFHADMRNYSAAADILKDLGVSRIRLITNNPDKIDNLTDLGINVCERVPVETEHRKESEFYMHTKKEKMNHILNTY